MHYILASEKIPQSMQPGESKQNLNEPSGGGIFGGGLGVGGSGGGSGLGGTAAHTTSSAPTAGGKYY